MSQKEEKPTSQDLLIMIQELRSDVRDAKERTDRLERALEAHNIVCAANTKTLEEVRELILTVKTGMKITNFLRNSLLLLAGLGTALAEAYNTWWRK